MSHTDTDRIRQLLSQKPGLKAQQIANELGLDRAQVSAMLQGLADEVVQDNAYRWWPKTRSRQASNGTAPGQRTFLARLCRYYLECLSRESGAGISIPAADDGSYVVLDELPFADEQEQPLADTRTIKRIVHKVQREPGQLALYVGYPIRVRSVTFKTEEQLRIEPLLLYPIDDTSEQFSGPLRPANGIPLFNLEVLKSLSAVDTGNVIDEAMALSEELGLANAEEDLPQWDEIILRLQRCRPDWGWKEDLNPYMLSRVAPVAELSSTGIYNRAVLFAGTRSPFTYGLEIELRKLAALDEETIRDTALGHWLRGTSIEAAAGAD